MATSVPPASAPMTSTAGVSPALAWLLDRAAFDDDARAAVTKANPAALAPGAADPGLVVQALLDADLAPAALRVVAVALPPREGVWWAWVAARHAVGVQQQRAAQPGTPDAPAPPPPPAVAFDTLAAVERWIAQPTDEHRRAAWALAEKAGMDSPAGAAAAAAFMTNGSLTPLGGPFVPAPAGLHTTLAFAAVLAAAVATDPAHLKDIAAAFVAQGLEVVKRLGGWEPALVAAKQTFDHQAEVHAEASKPPKLPNA